MTRRISQPIAAPSLIAKDWLLWDWEEAIRHSRRPSELSLEIEMVMVSASRIEHRATAWALVGTIQILADRQLCSACPTQDCRLIPFSLWPDCDRMAG